MLYIVSDEFLCHSLPSHARLLIYIIFYDVLSTASYDSTKVFDRTEFLVQRYEAESNEWAVVSFFFFRPKG